MSAIQNGVVSAGTQSMLAKLRKKVEQKKQNHLQTSSASSNIISTDMMTPSLPVRPPVAVPKPMVLVPEPKPVVSPPPLVNPVVEALKLTPKRRASIVIQPKVPSKTTQPGKLRRGELVRVNEHEYKIERDIGSGGSCVVYKARVHKAPEVNQNRELIALKIVDLSNADRELKKIFENEIQFLKKLQDSPFVITMIDHQRVRDKLYVVMELGERNFKEQMKIFKEAGRLDESTLRYFWTQMLQCVNVIHELNIVHADLKPANFVLVNSLLKLIDFGIAAQIVADETTVYRKGVQGTLNYISPEAISCRPNGDGYEIPLKSDVWSLGCILYALVYGEPPFAHIDRQEKKLAAIMHDPIKFRIKSANGAPVNEPLLDVLKCCLTRDLDKRPSVRELLRHRYVTNLCAS